MAGRGNGHLGKGGRPLGLGQQEALADPDEVGIADVVDLLQRPDAGPVVLGDEGKVLAGLDGVCIGLQGCVLAAEMRRHAVRDTQAVAAGDGAPALADGPAEGRVEVKQPLG